MFFVIFVLFNSCNGYLDIFTRVCSEYYCGRGQVMKRLLCSVSRHCFIFYTGLSIPFLDQDVSKMRCSPMNDLVLIDVKNCSCAKLLRYLLSKSAVKLFVYRTMHYRVPVYSNT